MLGSPAAYLRSAASTESRRSNIIPVSCDFAIATHRVVYKLGSEQESEQVMDWRALLKAKIFVRSVDERERMDEDFRVAEVPGVSERGQ